MSDDVPQPRGLRGQIKQAQETYSLGRDLVETALNLRTKWREWRSYTLTVASDDPIYPDVQDWVLSEAPQEKQRSLALTTERDYGRPYDVDGNDPGVANVNVRLAYASDQEVRLTLDSHQVWVRLRRQDNDPTEKGQGTKRLPDRIFFRCTSPQGQRAVGDHIERIARRHAATQRRPQLYLLSSWGSWQRRQDVPPRELASVVLPRGQLEDLVADLREFLSREAEYARLGLPWHRGYLLQGPPGTGKTSIVKALANHLNLELWYAPLADVDRDTGLLSLLSSVRPRSLLLLEDIDTFHVATQRDTQEGEGGGKLSLSGLLNALDGVATPHGLITFLTSNNPEVLDEALVRPGRIDRIEDVGYVVPEQARRLFEFFYGRPPTGTLPVGRETTTATLVEVFKRHLQDPRGAERALAARSESNHRGNREEAVTP